MVTFAKGTKWILILVGIGVAAGVGIITLAALQQLDIEQNEVIYDNEVPWMNPSFLQSYQDNLRTGAHYKSRLGVGEEGFFYADARGGKEPYKFEWKFSDGVVKTVQNATRTFESPGNYTAQLTVTDAGGQKRNSNISVQVLP